MSIESVSKAVIICLEILLRIVSILVSHSPENSEANNLKISGS